MFQFGTIILHSEIAIVFMLPIAEFALFPIVEDHAWDLLRVIEDLKLI